MNLKNFRKARKLAERPAKINFRNILAVIQAWFRKKKLTISGIGLEQHIYEQIIWRRLKVKAKSPICWESGACRVCGCDILGKTMEDRACSLSESPESNKTPCYPAMMSKEKWEAYKTNYKIKLFE
jgi:hypothetical protein